MQNLERRTFLALAAGALAASSLAACRAVPSRPPARSWRAMRALLDLYVTQRGLPGALAAVSYDDEPLAYLTSGTLALDSRVPVDENSLWRIYSMTQPVTGFAAMLLIEDGRLELDQPVADVLPEFRSPRVLTNPQSFETRPAVRVMTMRHLLTHTAGFDYWIYETSTDALPRAHRQRGITPGDYGFGLGGGVHAEYGPQARGLPEMISRLAELPLAHDPGTRFHYSVGLDVMGAVIERITGQGLDVFMRERIFDPLRMPSTGFQVSRQDAARLTTLYKVTPDGLKPLDAGPTSAWLERPTLLAGGAGLVTSARELARFGAMLLGEGALDGVRVAQVETVRLALSNLLPEGVHHSGGGHGAGAQRALPGSDAEPARIGTFGWLGAAGTVWWIDPARRGQVVFMTQHLPYDAYPYWQEVSEAIGADLAAAQPHARRLFRSSAALVDGNLRMPGRMWREAPALPARSGIAG